MSSPVQMPPLDPLKDRERQLQDLRVALGGVLECMNVARNCLTCKNFIEPMETCTYQNANMRPPARVIAYGCRNHSSEIPF